MSSIRRAGRVKYYMTPKVQPTNTDHSYSEQGRSKFRKKSSTNVQYKSGANRLHQSGKPSSELSSSSRVILNSYHKYNTERGHNRVVYRKIVEEDHEYEIRMNNQQQGRKRDTNHNKWHRNHPKDGFYQKREDFGTNDE